jgi:tetratricopeptide (TPR) repeat protein
MIRSETDEVMIASLLFFLALQGTPPATEVDFAARWQVQGETLERAGQLAEAGAAYARVLERDARSLGALSGLVRVESTSGNLDAALDHAGRFLEVWRHLKLKPASLQARAAELANFAREKDPLRKRLDTLRREYVTRLLKLAGEQMDNLSWHSARAMLSEAQFVDPEHPELGMGVARIRKEGGNELAVEDETGGADPLAGVTPEWVAEEDPKHREWDKAWTLDTKHYRVKTNAGYRVLKTTANAMEQVQVFYRIFHDYKTDGSDIPIANVWIFRNAAEYKEIGGQPTDWAAGHWDGSSVVTYDPRGENSEAGLSDLLNTLFHEASHQFTSLCGGPSVPAWLNEGMASFFEGTKLLSNGKLDWNLVASHRLYPLLEDIKAGKNTLAGVIEGKVDDYRVYYPWGWGIVYYLYNAEDDEGRLIYRPLMREYYREYSTDQHLERFTEYFLTRAAVPGVSTIEQFEQRFKAYMSELEAFDKGQLDAARRFEERGDQQMRLKDYARAVEYYGRSLARDPGFPPVLWKQAEALEKHQETDRAAGVLRQWLSVLTPGFLDGSADAQTLAQRAQALARIPKLDTSAKRLQELRTKFHADSVALADDYDRGGFARLALRVLRAPATAQPPSERARTRYFEISDKSGVSLESWRLIFNERDLKGFYGGGEGDFTVQDGVLVANIRADSDNGAKPEGPSTGAGSGGAAKASDVFAFRRLFIDVEPAGDWSLSAEVKLSERSSLAGLCFGRKADGRFQGVGLLPKGYVDLASMGSTEGKPLTRNKIDLKPDWNRLRIDVAGTRLVVFLNETPVIDYLFDSRAELRGDFGLLAGLGEAHFREIRLLEYDESLPRRAKLGFRKSAPVIDEATGAMSVTRAPSGLANYLNQAPPKLEVDGWIGTPPGGGDLDQLLGWPVILLFWSTYSEAALPQLPAVEQWQKLAKDLDIPILLLSNEKPETVQAYASEKGLTLPIAHDWSQRLYKAYAIDKVQLPHAKLIGIDGLVAWEGNPDYKAAYGSYLDEPLQTMLQRSKLPELKAAQMQLEQAKAKYATGDLAGAIALYSAIADLGVEHPRVAIARGKLAGLAAAAEALLEDAQGKLGSKRLLEGLRVLDGIVRDFSPLAPALEAKALLEKRAKESAVVKARQLETRLKGIEKLVSAGALDKALAGAQALAAKLDAASDPWAALRTRWLAEECAQGKDAKLVWERYQSQFPGAVN